MNKKVLLLILDGYGYNPNSEGNAILAARTPNLDKFKKENATALLQTTGLAVGLPEGIMGNSEVGHLNIGAGRIVFQLNTLIDEMIKAGRFDKNPQLNEAIDHVLETGGDLHLFGLLSDGNVHSNLNHLWALLRLCKNKGIREVFYHVFTDGRDTLPRSGIDFVKLFVKKSKEIGIGKIATITGRYYSMDRDNRWDRVEKGYDALVKGKGEYYNDEVSTVQDSYNKDITDEFILPKILIENGKPRAIIKENDAVIAFNFRADRMRELTRSFVMPDFEEFKATKFKNLKYVCFNEYDVDFNPFTEVAFRLPKLTQILGEVISEKGIKQLRLAETEKYAHVTFFFNGGVEKPFENEERILVPSPKVATYDLQPEMSAIEVKDKLISALKAGEYPFIVTNFANCDMVGHTGFFDKAVKAVETVDKCVGEVIAEATKQKYNIILTADHGNADVMTDENGNTFTAHSMNPVEVVISLNSDNKIVILDGKLADIAPTVLKIMNIPIPKEMTGNVLII
jgi:2,3-bisphosphoglycerate-independent phosphoglycerate mutase